MKHIITFSLFSCLVLTIQAQVLNPESHWTEIITDFSNDTYMEIDEYEIEGDTIIHDTTYMKVYKNNLFFGSIRETKDSLIYLYNPNLDEDRLVYDFSYWHVGDSILFQFYDDWFHIQYDMEYFGYTITEIDSILLENGKYRKMIQTELIKGIGFSRGFFNHMYSTALNTEKELLCFYVGDELLYTNPDYDFCSATDIPILEKEDIEVQKFSIYTITASLIGSYHTQQLPEQVYHNLKSGVYILKITTTDNTFFSKKMVIP